MTRRLKSALPYPLISRWRVRADRVNKPGMKSCLGMLVILAALALVIGGAAAIWYLSESAEFSRKGKQAPPRAAPVSGVR